LKNPGGFNDQTQKEKWSYKSNFIEGRLISRCQIFEEQYWKIKKNNKKVVKK
jgi:hypothetical protein